MLKYFLENLLNLVKIKSKKIIKNVLIQYTAFPYFNIIINHNVLILQITFWLIENNYRVLIAGCDTFRAGAVEQLRTHMHHLNAIHPPEKHGGQQMVQLFEQGYGKDAADIARHGIDFARKNSFDVVLIDTAGRMQDNEPLMRALAKLIHVNRPDMTLFVGEALVGNEAVDQLVKFNRALADQASLGVNKNQVIDGIVLTKFDTIDDKVRLIFALLFYVCFFL